MCEKYFTLSVDKTNSKNVKLEAWSQGISVSFTSLNELGQWFEDEVIPLVNTFRNPLPIYADRHAAIAGGLQAGALYCTNDGNGELLVKRV